MAKARASRAAKLRTARIVGGRNKVDRGVELELKRHVPHVECDSKASVVNDDSDEEDWGGKYHGFETHLVKLFKISGHCLTFTRTSRGNTDSRATVPDERFTVEEHRGSHKA